MPAMPYRLPRRADSCAESPARLKMKSRPAPRYATVTRVSGMSAAEHAQHSLRDEEAAGDVDRRQQDRGGAEDGDGRRRRAAHLQHAADHYYAADRVGHAH